MRLLASFDTTALPLYRLLSLSDAESDADDVALISHLTRDEGSVGNGYLIYISSLQSIVSVSVKLRVWDEIPDPDEEPYEGETLLKLYVSSGTLVLREIAGGVPGEWPISLPGWYDVRVRWQGRAMAENILARSDISFDEAMQLAESEARETYCLDLAFSETQDQPEDEADD